MMSSSDGRGVARKAAVAAEPGNSSGPGGSQAGSEAAGFEPDDPWFGVSPRPTAAASAFDPEATQVDWFLPGGRSALLPESMTTSSDEGEPGRQQHLAPPEAAGAPPWAAETTGSAALEPPPWENGPWTGPGGAWPERPPVRPSDRQPAARPDDSAGPWTPRAVVITGLLPLVVPGLVVGLLGLRRSRSGEPGRLASMLALAASLAWAVVIAVLVAANSGGSSGGCSYPAAVHKAYATAMADLSSGAPAATQATDLGLAASDANSAAAAARQIQVRTALTGMAGDLQEARADVIAKGKGTVPPTLREHLVADGAALTASCPA